MRLRRAIPLVMTAVLGVMLMTTPAHGNWCRRLLNRVTSPFMDFMMGFIAPYELRYLNHPVSMWRARGLVRRVYNHCQSCFGPPLSPLLSHSSREELLLVVWMGSYEAFAVPGLTRLQKEIIASSISELNACHY